MRAAALLAAALVALPARAEEPSHALDLSLAPTWAFMSTSSVDHRGELWSTNGGLGVAGTVAWRSPYFLVPFLDVAWAPLYASSRQVDLGSAGGPAVTTGRMSVLALVAGAGVEPWRLRLRMGIGLHDLFVRSSVNGSDLHTSEWDMGYFASVGGTVVEVEGFRLGLEARGDLILDAGITFFSVGASVSYDAWSF